VAEATLKIFFEFGATELICSSDSLAVVVMAEHPPLHIPLVQSVSAAHVI
jgi:hypothetical protein